MASTIKAGNATDGIQITSDNTGILELKTGTGSGTTALTLSTGQNATFAGTITVANGITGDLKFNSGYGSVATAYGCRAWVNFNGTGTVAIRASGNVTSITDGGVGIYTVNFTNAMPDVNFSVIGMKTNASSDSDSSIQDVYANRTTSSCQIFCKESAANTDSNNVNISVFR